MTHAVASVTTTAPGQVRGATKLAPAQLVGGIGGLVFAVSVAAQNLLRSVDLPGDNANPASVTAYYASHRGVTLALAALYPIGALGLAAFLGALLSRLSAPAVRGAALAGGFGGAGIIAMFTVTLATDTALAQYVHHGHPAPDVVSAMWLTHNAVFGVLLVSIGVALAGLSAASAGAGLVPAAWKRVGLIGAIALAVAGGCTPALLDGSKVLILGLLGFLTWLLFVATAAIALIRRSTAGAASAATETWADLSATVQ